MVKPSRGTLVAVGGAEDKVAERLILRRILAHAPGDARRVEIIPTASAEPREAARPYVDAFRALGVPEAGVMDIRSSADAANADFVQRIRTADVVYMTGGDQVRLSAILDETPAMAAMREKVAAGGVVAGSSAGAAAMSATMIAEGATTLRKGHVRLTAGLGLLPGAIVDTHFTERGRFARLMEAVTTHPHLLGLGIGENTAVVVRGSTLEVVGSGLVAVFDAHEVRSSNVDEVDDDHPVAVERMIVHTLVEGHHYDLAQRRAYPPLRALARPRKQPPGSRA